MCQHGPWLLFPMQHSHSHQRGLVHVHVWPREISFSLMSQRLLPALFSRLPERSRAISQIPGISIVTLWGTTHPLVMEVSMAVPDNILMRSQACPLLLYVRTART